MKTKLDIYCGILFILFILGILAFTSWNTDRLLDKCEKINNRQCDLNELRNYQ